MNTTSPSPGAPRSPAQAPRTRGRTRPWIVAHRGGRHAGLPGEQTERHFEAAIARGADFIEVDLRRTSDGELVCVHDAVYAGVTIASSTLADLCAGSATRPGWSTRASTMRSWRGSR